MTQHPCLKSHHRYNASSLSPQVGVYAHEHEDLQTDNFMKVYSPTQGDECYITSDSDGNIDAVEGSWLFQTKNELRHCNTLFKPSTSGSAPQGV